MRDAIEEIVIGKAGKSMGMVDDVCKNKFSHIGQHSNTQGGKGRCTPEQPSRFQKLKTGTAAPGCSTAAGRPKPVPIPDPGLRSTALRVFGNPFVFRVLLVHKPVFSQLTRA
jgi:hypothetical protein